MRLQLTKRFDIIAAAGAFVILSLFYGMYQPQITLNNGLEWDGQYYAKITKDFASGQRPDTEAPFVYRIGIPYIASLLGPDVIQSWRFLGILFNILTFILLYYLLTLHLKDQYVRFLLLILFLLKVTSPLKLVWYAPVQTGHFDKLFLILGLIILHYIKQSGWTIPRALFLTVVTFAGVLCREIVGVLAIVAFFVDNPIQSNKVKSRWHISPPPGIVFLPLLSAVAAIVLVRLIVTPQPGDGFIRTAIMFLYTKPLPDYLLAWFIAFSPALILPLYDWRNTRNFLFANQYLAVYLIIFAILGWIGGSATHRLVYWAMPAVFILVGKSLQNMKALLTRNWMFIFICVFSVMFSQRVFWLLPDYPGGESMPWVFMTPLTGNANILDILGSGSLRVRILSTVSYAFVAIVLLTLLHVSSRRSRTIDVLAEQTGAGDAQPAHSGSQMPDPER